VPVKTKPTYRGYIELKNGLVKYGPDCFDTRREALLDAARIVREIQAEPRCEWRNDIRTYGSVRDAI